MIISLQTYRDNRSIDYSEPTSTVVQPAKARKPRQQCGGLYYYPRLGVWRASNVEINPDTLKGTSYQWWVMTDRIGGVVVLNSYRYSAMTCKHQGKAREFFRQQGIEYVSIESPRGLQDLESSITYYQRSIDSLNQLINKPGTRKAKNLERKAEIQRIQSKTTLVRQLIRVRGRS